MSPEKSTEAMNDSLNVVVRASHTLRATSGSDAAAWSAIVSRPAYHSSNDEGAGVTLVAAIASASGHVSSGAWVGSNRYR